MELRLPLEIITMPTYNPMTTLQWRPVDPGHPKWSLGSRWTATTTYLQLTRATTRMELRLPLETTTALAYDPAITLQQHPDDPGHLG